MVESFNRTWNSLSGHSPNVFAIQELFVKQDAEARRAYLSNAVGLDKFKSKGEMKELQTHSGICCRSFPYHVQS